MSSIATAVLFPGQGAQVFGMGKNFAESSQDVMELWKKAEKISRIPLREIYWESKDDALMAETQNLQPAITVVNLALWSVLKSKVTASAFAGHSLGEFSALAAAKVLPIDNIFELVSLRGRLMAEVDPEHIGSMLAIIRLNYEQVEEAVKIVAEKSGKLVRIANKNTPLQFVISGHKEAVDETGELLKANNPRAKTFPLAVSGAFHTAMMAEASAEFAKLLDKQDWHDAVLPIYSNFNGSPRIHAKDIHNAMRRQMTSQVCWLETITNQWNNGLRRWVEVGPQGVLSRMVRPILSSLEVQDSSYSIVHVSGIETLNAFKG